MTGSGSGTAVNEGHQFRLEKESRILQGGIWSRRRRGRGRYEAAQHIWLGRHRNVGVEGRLYGRVYFLQHRLQRFRGKEVLASQKLVGLLDHPAPRVVGPCSVGGAKDIMHALRVQGL